MYSPIDVRQCTRCPALVANRKQAIPAEAGARYTEGGVAIMTSAPSKWEDNAGRLFVGKEGKQLDTLLQIAGMSRDEILLMSTVRCAPPKNRLDKHPEARLACDDWTRAELEAYNPSVVLLLGNEPMREVYGKQKNITTTRGNVRGTDEHQWGRRIYVPTFRPSYVVREPSAGSLVVKDFKLANELCRLHRTL